MNYFKRKWDDTRGDEYDHWGTSMWYIETNSNGEPLKHIEQYDNGKILKYSETYTEDAFGMLMDATLDLEEFEEYKITKEAFYLLWDAE